MLDAMQNPCKLFLVVFLKTVKKVIKGVIFVQENEYCENPVFTFINPCIK